MDIKKWRQELDNKKIGAVELAKHYLHRIDKYDKELGCYLYVDSNHVIKQAEKAQNIIDSGNQSYLTGIPIGIKDNIVTKGIPTTASSKMLENFTPNYNAHIIEEMEKQGYVMLGKLNMDEFAMGGSNETSYYKVTKNPFDKSKVPGGSSGGSAAAVAAGLCAAAIGSDTGGSITQPASFCGITGIKATYGTVSRYGSIPFADSLDQLGPMANSIYDCASILSVISSYDQRDSNMVKRQNTDYFKYIDKPIKGMKIGVLKELISQADECVSKHVYEAIKLYEDMGAIITEVDIPYLDYATTTYKAFAWAQGAINLNKFDGFKFGYESKNMAPSCKEEVMVNRGNGFGYEVKKRVLIGAYSLQKGHYKKASEVRRLIRHGYKNAINTCDVIVNPTALTTAFELNHIKNHVDNCTVGINLAGLPSLSTTCGYDKNGMPIGICLVGNYFEEAKMIGIAHAFECQFNRRIPKL